MRVQISSGQGPAECELAVGLLFEQLQRKRMDIRLIQNVRGRNAGGYFSILLETKKDAWELEGSVLWVCKSPFRPEYRRKNRYIDVSMLEQLPDVAEDMQLCSETFRSGGKDRQHVNKVETGIRVIHILTGISVVSIEARSQHMNKKLAVNHLCDILSEKDLENRQKEKELVWLRRTRLERGSPVRIYEGTKLIRRK